MIAMPGMNESTILRLPLRRRIVPVAGVHLERGAIARDADLDLAVVRGGRRGVVDQGVLAARLFHRGAVGGLQGPGGELGENFSPRGRSILWKNIVVALARN